MKKFSIILLAVTMACNTPSKKTIGSIERLDPALDQLISPGVTIEIIGEGFDWTEGPLWVEQENMLLFSDIPPNAIYKWTEEKGTELYLKPSGYTGDGVREREPGSNGLLLSGNSLVLCQHGDRRMAKMTAPLSDPKPEFITLASEYNGKKFSSPNDAVFGSNGDLFFTDPPYGLAQGDDDPEKETPVNGVYKVNSDRVVSLLVDSITRPNGIGLFPGEKKLLVANSDPAKAIWYVFNINEADSLEDARVFFDATEFVGKEKGLPDGLKIDKNGNVFATGPGGVWIFNKEGTLLGKLKIPEASSNCALSPDEKTLYITADMFLLRIRLRD